MLENQRPKNAAVDGVLLSSILRGYLVSKDGMASYEQAEIAVDRFIDFWSGKSVADAADAAEQERYVAARQKAGVSLSTIARELGVLRAALRRAFQKGEITSAPFIRYVETADDLRDDDPKGRPLTLAEMARVFNVTKTVRVRRYLMILANTLCRPGAGLELTRFQVDLDHGLVALNPPGRKQTKKYRPVVPLTDSLRPWMTGFKGDRFMAYGTRKVTSAKNTWRRLRAAAGLDGEVNGYSFRHTMARELRGRGVPAEQIELMLGHRRPGGHSATSQTYAPYAPEYCREAAAAIDGVMRDLQKLVRFPIIGPKVARAIAVAGGDGGRSA